MTARGQLGPEDHQLIQARSLTGQIGQRQRVPAPTIRAVGEGPGVEVLQCLTEAGVVAAPFPMDGMKWGALWGIGGYFLRIHYREIYHF